MTKEELKNQEQQEVIKSLKLIIKPMDTIYTILRHCSSNGMNRIIDCYIVKKNKPLWIGRQVAKALGSNYGKYNSNKQGIKVNGCGMDMGFAIIYELADVLFKGGDGKTVTGRNGDTKPETDGGYLLKQAWL